MRTRTPAPTVVLLALGLASFGGAFVACGGEDPPIVNSSKKSASGGAGAGGSADAGAAGTAGAAGSDLGGAAGADAGSAGAAGDGAGAAGAAGDSGAAGAGGDGTAGAGAGGAGAGGAGAGGSGGAAGDGSAGAGGKPKPKGDGYVQVFVGKVSASTFSNDGTARFVKAPVDGTTFPCTTEDLTGTFCKVRTCNGTTQSPAEVVEDGGEMDVQANAVSVMHIGHDDKSLTYGPVETNLPTDKGVYNPGDTLTIFGSGFTAPSFNGDIVAPGPIALSSPAAPAPGGVVTIDTSGPFNVAMSGGGSGSLEITIKSASKTNPLINTTVTCTMPAGSSTGSIASSVLKKLPVADAAGFLTEISFLSVTEAPVPLLTSYDVKLRATTHVADGGGSPWSVQQVTLK